jgi:outer membrane protein assembly factor BamB
MWRYDANRSAASANSIPNELALIWKRDFASRKQAWDDPLNLDLMTYDQVFEPIVVEGKLCIGFNDRDKLVALDAATGEEKWVAYAEAPVRLPPVGWNGRVLFCSDDGYLYCVQADDGKLLWKLNAAPNAQHAIGNRRLTSAWPARGGPVVRDGVVYFAASIWPFMGTFIYAIDVESGKVQWVNDSTGSQYIKQPHSAPSFAGVAPQGSLVATEKRLIVPGGRSVPAVFDRSNGKQLYFEINAGGKGTGGAFVTADESHFYVHTREKGTRAFELESGLKTAFMPNEPVLANGTLYSAEQDKNQQQVIRAYDAAQKVLWETPADGRGDLILAGHTLWAAGEHSITGISLPASGQPAKVTATIDIDGTVKRLIAAQEQLFAVTMEGQIMAFGEKATQAGRSKVMMASSAEPTSINPTSEAAAIAAELLSVSAAEGFAFWFGRADTPIVEALSAKSPFHQFAIVDTDRDRVESLRRKLDSADIYGQVTVHCSEAHAFRAPHYVAHMLFVGHDVTELADEKLIRNLYESVRPYGGTMQLLTSGNRESVAKWVESLALEQAQVELHNHSVVVRRQGALPGSADWTHQYGDVANTIKSNDQRVKLPLGILWFGGSSNTDVLPRHGHGPPEQVVGGRLFIQGVNSLSARDVYTGRVLWKREFENLGTYDVYFDDTYEDVPLDTKYNQVHIPGANGRGTNYVVTEDKIYLLEENVCHVLDPATGVTLNDIRMPQDDSGDTPEWGYIGVYGDMLIGGRGFAMYRERHELSFESDSALSKTKAGFGSKSLDRAASAGLVGFDRHTGQVLWNVSANHSFWHNGIVAGGGKIFCLDKNPSQVEEAMRRRGLEMPASYRIAALHPKTGNVDWEIKDNIFGTWLGYSENHGLLLQASAKASDRLSIESGQGIAVYRGQDGQLVWKNDSLSYSGPCILHNDLIITNVNSYTQSAGAYYLKTGKPKLVANPLTGEEQPWTLTRAYGCNNIIASENMLTFRSGAAGFCDLLSDAGTGNLGGFKSGCTSNLVVANGVLNAPDYTRTCSCSYQNQTSLALVNMPDMDVWSVDSLAPAASAEKRIQEVAINFGAPGDRRDSEGKLWIEYPVVAGEAPSLPISLNPEARPFLFHTSTMSDLEKPWVLSSGVEGATDLRIGFVMKERVKPEAEKSSDDDGESSAKKDKKKAAPAKAVESSKKKNDAVLSKKNAAKLAKEILLAPEAYDIRLHFAVPSQLQGTREFDVHVQGELAIERVRLDPSGGPDQRYSTRELKNVLISNELRLQFTPREGSPVLNGIEIIRNHPQ